MASVIAGVGGTASTASYALTAEDKRIQGYLAAFVSGSFVGGLTGASGPAAGTLARSLGHKANSAMATTLHSSMNFTSGTAGSVLNDVLSGQEISMSNALLSGTTSGVATPLISSYLPSQHGTSTLQQTLYFGVRTLNGLVSPVGPNAGRLIQGSVTGSTVSGGVENTVDQMMDLFVGD